jgi:hypothetical protein
VRLAGLQGGYRRIGDHSLQPSLKTEANGTRSREALERQAQRMTSCLRCGDELTRLGCFSPLRRPATRFRGRSTRPRNTPRVAPVDSSLPRNVPRRHSFEWHGARVAGGRS